MDNQYTDKIRRLRGVTWEWRDEAPEQAKDQPGMGIIAQDVEAVFPDLIEHTESGLLRVDYDGLIPPLIEAIKELDVRVTALEARIGEHDADR